MAFGFVPEKALKSVNLVVIDEPAKLNLCQPALTHHHSHPFVQIKCRMAL